MTDQAPRRAPGRLGLFAPFLLVAAALLAWSLYWVTVAHRTSDGFDRIVRGLKRQGYAVSYDRRSVSGWPFRTFLQVRDLQARAPSGLAFRTSRLAVEARAYDLDRWVGALPEGFSLARPGLGRLDVTGLALRASLAGVLSGSPRLAVELRGVRIVPAPGARPGPLLGADRIEVYSRLHGGDSRRLDILVRTQRAIAPKDSLLARLTGDRPLDLDLETTTGGAPLVGFDPAGALAAFARAQGRLSPFRFTARMEDDVVEGRSAGLRFDRQGRLIGRVDLSAPGRDEAVLDLDAAGVRIGDTRLGRPVEVR